MLARTGEILEDSVACAAAGNFGAAPCKIGPAEFFETVPRMLDQLRCEDFLPLIGQRVTVHIADSSAELEVAEAEPIKAPTPRATPPFRVVLRSPPDWRANQGMFRIEHPTLGDIELFAVPIGPDGKGLCYEIVFN